jgi:hypothetical protein
MSRVKFYPASARQFLIFSSSQPVPSHSRHFLNIKIADLLPEKEQFKYFEKLLDFVDIDPAIEEINYTLAGYFMKVVNTIILARPKEALLYIYNNAKHTDNLIKHLYSKSITNLLVVIINAPKDLFSESVPVNDMVKFSQQIFPLRKAIFERLIQLACKTSYEIENQEMHINICSILIDMIIRVEQLIDGKQLYIHVFEKENHLEEIFMATIPDVFLKKPKISNSQTIALVGYQLSCGI